MMGNMKPVLVLGFALAGLMPAETLSQGERDRAMSYLHATRKMFLDAVADVTPKQWSWKPSPEVWSVAEVAEHIAVSEDTLFGLVRKLAAGPVASEQQRAETKGKDETMPKGMVDRSRKAQAPEMLRPTHRWKTKEELVAHFKQSRDATIEYVKTTGEDLRAHVNAHPAFGPLDGYQWILLIAAHSERHILQLKEVKDMAGFPKP